jgi:hypothetical protein
MQRFYTTVTRYVNGKLVVASPEHPALVEFPDELVVSKTDKSLTPAEETPGVPRAVPVAGKIQPPHGAQPAKAPNMATRDHDKRASDVDPAA